jgi:hypothetical protein
MTDTATEAPPFEAWAIVELMGHRRLAGKVSEQRIAGATLLRIDVPRGSGFTTTFYGSTAIFSLTPTTEDVVRAVALHSQPEPVSRWELTPPNDDDEPM